MVINDPVAIKAILDMYEDVWRESEERYAEHLRLHGPPPPLTRRERLDLRVRHLRERVARKIAPWLDEY